MQSELVALYKPLIEYLKIYVIASNISSNNKILFNYCDKKVSSTSVLQITPNLLDSISSSLEWQPYPCLS